MSYPQHHVLPSSHPKTPRHSLKKASMQTPICLLIALCHVASKLGVNNDSQEGRLPGGIQTLELHPPHKQIRASSSQQDIYFHSFVISAVQSSEWGR